MLGEFAVRLSFLETSTSQHSLDMRRAKDLRRVSPRLQQWLNRQGNIKRNKRLTTNSLGSFLLGCWVALSISLSLEQAHEWMSRAETLCHIDLGHKNFENTRLARCLWQNNKKAAKQSFLSYSNLMSWKDWRTQSERIVRLLLPVSSFLSSRNKQRGKKKRNSTKKFSHLFLISSHLLCARIRGAPWHWRATFLSFSALCSGGKRRGK